MEINIKQLEEDIAKMECFNEFYKENKKDDELYEENLQYQKRQIKYMYFIYKQKKESANFLSSLNK